MEQFLLHRCEYTAENIEVERLKNKFTESFSDTELSIRQVLSEEAYCQDHMRRLFKQSTGLTPNDYLTEVRLNYAKKLLRENDKLRYTITEIGAMSGFDCTDYFSRIFKKKTGKSPTEYIRNPE